MLSHQQYIKMLEPWCNAIIKELRQAQGNESLEYYGDGSDGWGVQTNQKALSALCVLVSDPISNEICMGISRDKLLGHTLAMLRYSLETHHSGSFHLTDGKDIRWGHTWISALGIERMMHGVEAIEEHLTQSDKEALKRVLISESEWLLEHYNVEAGLTESNKPESNLWNGSILIRTALMYPDEKNVKYYFDKGVEFLMNSISIPEDSTSDVILDGYKTKDKFKGANFFESYSLNHHGYLNVGYMVITLSQIAMLHFSCRKSNFQPPQALYQHFEKLWQLVKLFLFDDGRLNRIGGDTRVRYCYCQDYLIPVLALVSDCLGEDTARYEKGWLEIVKKEVSYNADGSFLSNRCDLFKDMSPLYYTRLESDRACGLSMGAYWRRVYNNFKNPYGTYDYKVDTEWKNPMSSWIDEYHGSCFIKESNRIASFTWIAAEGPQGMCIPPSDSSLAEWKNNMTSEIFGDGLTNENIILNHKQKLIDNGFITSGSYMAKTKGLLSEQTDEEIIAINSIAFVALPDGASVVTLQLAKAAKRCHIREVKALKLNIPNDIFNGFKRRYVHENGCVQYNGSLDDVYGNTKLISNWVNIDGNMSVICMGGELFLNHTNYRQIGLRNMLYQKRGMLRCDEICTKIQLSPKWYDKDETIFDFSAIITAGMDAAETRKMADSVILPKAEGEGCRCVCVTGKDGKQYLVAANFSENAQKFDVILPNGGRVTAKLDSCEADVIKL